MRTQFTLMFTYPQPTMRLSKTTTEHLRDAIVRMKMEERFQFEVLQNILPSEIIQQVITSFSNIACQHLQKFEFHYFPLFFFPIHLAIR